MRAEILSNLYILTHSNASRLTMERYTVSVLEKKKENDSDKKHTESIRKSLTCI